MQLVWITLATLAVLTQMSQCRPSSLCGGPADIVFVVDTSSSIWSIDFEKNVRPFVRDVTNMFDVGSAPLQTRIGLVTFSDRHHLVFHLNTHSSKENTLHAIMNMPRIIGNTNTSDALRFIAGKMFTTKHGSRKQFAHVAVVVTDGKSQDYEATKAAALAAKEAGIEIFALGVGDGVDEAELADIASDPKDNFVMQVTDFDALWSIKNQLAAKACHVTTTKPIITTPTTTSPTTMSSTTNTPTVSTTQKTSTSTTTSAITTPSTTNIQTVSTPKDTTSSSASPEVTTVTPRDLQGDQELGYKTCGGKPADVYFVLDSSASINVNDFNHEVLGFVRNISEIFDIGIEKTRVGVMSFSDRPVSVIGLNDHHSLAQLKSAISPETIPFLAGGTNTAAAIEHARKIGFSPEVARPEVAHVIVIITDGQSRSPTKTSIEAEAAKQAGIYVFAIGVGPDVDQKELKTIASEPHRDFVFNVTDFSALMTIKHLLAIRTCRLLPQDRPKEEANGCKLEDSKVMFLFDSATIGLSATRLITSSLGNVMTSLAARTNQLSLGIKMQSCWSNGDISLTGRRLIAHALETHRESLYPRLAALIKDVRIKTLVKRGDLYNGRRVMVVLLDEASLERSSDVIAEAKRAKFNGVEVFVVTVGDVNRRIIRHIASTPHDEHILKVSDFSQLGKVTEDMTNRLCGEIQQPIRFPALKVQ